MVASTLGAVVSAPRTIGTFATLLFASSATAAEVSSVRSCQEDFSRKFNGHPSPLVLECAVFNDGEPFNATDTNSSNEVGGSADVVANNADRAYRRRNEETQAGSSNACNACLYSPPLLVANASDLRNSVKACMIVPAVLFELLPHGATSQRPTEKRLVVCIFASCPLTLVATCAALFGDKDVGEAAPRLRVKTAIYWKALIPLLPWAEAAPRADGDGKGKPLKFDATTQSAASDAPKATLTSSAVSISSASAHNAAESVAAFAIAPGAPPFGRFRCTGPPASFYQMPITSPPWPGAIRCGNRKFYPISFGIPSEDVVTCLPDKSLDFASLLPGKWSTYIFPMTSFGELEYKRMYREARFALSPRKGGWETMRVYEILAGGCVPLLGNMSAIPGGALSFLDRTLLKKLASLKGIDANALRVNVSNFDVKAYNNLAAALLRHTHQRLTTEAIARYMLNIIGKQNVSRVLFIANCGHGDFQCYLSLHGMRRLLGAGLVDVPRLEYMYKPQGLKPMQEVNRVTTCPQPLCTVVSGSFPQTVVRPAGASVPAYGGGFSYAFRLEEILVNRSDASVLARLQRREFDAVVVGSVSSLQGHQDRAGRRAAALFTQAERWYSPNEIIVIDGRDPPADQTFHNDLDALFGRGHYFLREIPQSCRNHAISPSKSSHSPVAKQ
eukprot:TRINITY_DN23863_c0_g1_i1.p1 TRINITY_DN23863_c0_g1~~TRINITY_DN23863_c0_g1_i1.p1  ORF type:complete len:746 (-),score=83.07 TRINITY_DN23863_c0_g1_i1:333-2348(-)